MACIVGTLHSINGDGVAHPELTLVLILASLPLMPYGTAVLENDRFRVGLKTYLKHAKGWLSIFLVMIAILLVMAAIMFVSALF
jgi:hypothetical protein